LVLNQDLQDLWIIDNVFGLDLRVIRRELLFILLFAAALRIGEKAGNESTV
jgi:hypothetical protein